MAKKKKKKPTVRKPRGDWGAINPVTKIVPNKKAYNRKKLKRNEDE